jgi:hypothetical protein
MEPLELSFTVACPPAHAFSVWAERTSLWWPPGHSVSGAPELVAFEPRAGGRIFERAAGGGTQVTIEHRGWERLGARAAERRERNGRGWAGLLPHYRAACQPV